MTLTLDGVPVTVPDDATVLEAAQKAGIEIPTLCWMPRSKPWASCLVCAVQIEGSRKMVPSCATRVAPGMSVITHGPVVERQRKIAIELLLSDHVGDCEPPCSVVCPGHLDIPGMNQAIAKGNLQRATEIVMDTIPIPAILGRICPTPCEARCRRKPVDGAVAVCSLKRYVGDEELDRADHFTPEVAPTTGKTVAVVGGGPAGISCAYFLRRAGHEVTLLDEREGLGGAMRDIPSERLPTEVIDAETAVLLRMGVELKLGCRVALGDIRPHFDAVVLAIGPVGEPIEGIDGTDRGLKVTKGTGATSAPGVFACGASVAPGRIAIRALGDGHAVARSVHTFLTGEAEPAGFSFRLEAERETTSFALSRMGLAESDAPRAETKAALSADDAREQAARCLQCGCAAASDCSLRDLASRYGANASHFKGTPRVTAIDTSHEEVVLEPSKCIFCGICVRIAAEHHEAAGMAYHGRGFTMSVEGPFGEPLAKALRTAARRCAEACPTGALYVREKKLEP